MDRIKSTEIVKEYMDPLSKRPVKKVHKLKVYETFSNTEKFLFNEAKFIIQRDLAEAEHKLKLEKELLDKEKVPKGYLPLNKTFNKNMERFIDKSLPDCIELDNNHILRLLSYYDGGNKGYISKNRMSDLFNDIKNELVKQGIRINEAKFTNEFLNFYVTAEEQCSIQSIKKCFNNILHNNWSEMVKFVNF
jgi:hypothetical protein